MHTSRSEENGHQGAHSVVRRSLWRFALLSTLALLVLGAGIQFLSVRAAERGATEDAVVRTRGFAVGVASPLVNHRVRRGDPAAVAQLARVLRSRLREGSFRHFVVYDEAGRILWSDAAAVIGRVVELEPAVKAALGTSSVTAALPGAEDRHPERIGDESGLLEVYVTTFDAERRPFVFEAYTSPDRIARDRTTLLETMLPLGLGGLLLFQLAILPLAVSLARNVDRERRRRSDLMFRSLQAWHVERRRLAHDLHDGVIQDLSAAGYAMAGVLETLPAGASGDSARRIGQRITHMLEEDLRTMRSLVGDLVPDALDGLGLAAAVDVVAARHRQTGMIVHVRVASGLEPGPVVSGVVYRVAREGLRNVERHADARSAWVELDVVDDSYVVKVRDDGRGTASRDLTMETDTDGHFGLSLLASLVGDVGGTLSLEDDPELGGAVLTARIPVETPA